MKLVPTQAAKERYVFTTARFCRAGSGPAGPALKLGHNTQRKIVPKKKNITYHHDKKILGFIDKLEAKEKAFNQNENKNNRENDKVYSHTLQIYLPSIENISAWITEPSFGCSSPEFLITAATASPK